MLTFGSLFAGIGGMDLGLERAGMVCKWQVEINPFARRVLEKHWPDVPKHDDVTTFDPKASGDFHVDVIAGGFPCQDISFAGNGAGLAGARSGLWYQYARIIGLIRPRYVLVENVSALLIRGLDAVLGTLASMGYDSEWGCIPASAVGAPHIRDRVFIIAYDEGRSQKNGVFIKGNGTETFKQAGRLRSLEERVKAWNGNMEVVPVMVRETHGVPNRMDRLTGLGNAVVPQVSEWVGRRIIEHDRAMQEMRG